nr:SJCHGC05329 protein [Schistosoma japonicum]
MIDFSRRSPHAAEVDILPKIIRIDREQYRRVNYDIPDVSACEKQSSIDSIMIDSTDNFGAKRARSRHRSRGPGVIIDRSEPFESDTGSFAAEQRLRKLRERLNLVDDAIAEIKAGTVVQSNFNFGDIRRP